MATPSDRLLRLLRERGELSFAEVMEEALYGEGGYYNRSDIPIGPRGDFVTGSSVSDLFGRATARLLGRLDVALGRPAAFLDAGCGDASHLAAVGAAVRETTADRELLGWDRIERPLPAGVERLADLDALAAPLDGLVFSYELFDALPVHRLVGRDDGSPGELLVGVDAAGRPEWRVGELSDPELPRLLGSCDLEPGQVADLAPGWAPLYRRLAGALGRGLLVTCDYGYERDRLLDARIRRHGTLACYKAHRVHRDALRDLGQQDLTAHVDFTALREAGEAAGLETIAFTRQALWLTALGVFDELGEAADLALRQQAAMLLDPEGMGDQIRVLVQGRGIDGVSVLDRTIVG